MSFEVYSRGDFGKFSGGEVAVFTRKFPWSIEQPKIWMGAIQVDVVGQGINKAGNPSYTEVSSWATDLKKRWIFHCPV